jgi:hypothetical protein
MKTHVYVPVEKDKMTTEGPQGKVVVDLIKQGWEYGGRVTLQDLFGTKKEFACLSKWAD